MNQSVSILLGISIGLIAGLISGFAIGFKAGFATTLESMKSVIDKNYLLTRKVKHDNDNIDEWKDMDSKQS